LLREDIEITRESSIFYAGWRVVGASFLGVMTGYSVLVPYTFSLFMKPLGATFNWKRDQISIAFGCAALMVAFCAPVIGHILDRYGPKRTIVPCTILFGVAFASLSLSTSSLIRFYLTFLFLGLAGAGTTQLAYSRAVSTWFTAHRGLALSLVAAGAGTGAIIMPLFAAWMMQRSGWRWAYAVLGISVLGVSVPATWLLVRESGTMHPSPRSATESKQNLQESISSNPFLLLVTAIFLYSISFNGIISHLAALLTDRGYSVRASAQVISLVGASGLAGRLFTGHLLDRFFAPHVSTLLFLLNVAGILLLSCNSLAAALVSAVAIGFSAGGESDLTPYLLSRYFGLKALSTLYGLAWTAFAISTALGPLFLGKLYTATGSYPVWGIQMLAIPVLPAG
jgi:MFS family permease